MKKAIDTNPLSQKMKTEKLSSSKKKETKTGKKIGWQI